MNIPARSDAIDGPVFIDRSAIRPGFRTARGLALGVSVESINFPDESSGRYTKNYSRNDNELRAEATDYHQRQPYAILVGVLFLPIVSCDDAGRGRSRGQENPSSFGAAVRFFRPRANRLTPHDDVDLFERFFLALYDESSITVRLFDVVNAPPRNRRPAEAETISFEQFIAEIVRTYRQRNDPPFQWAE